LATRVFELARQLGVTSKDILGKCRAEGLEVKNHMAALSAGLEATIHEWFAEMPSGGTAIEVAEHVDVEKARATAKRQRRRKTEAEPAKAEEPAAPAEAAVEQKAVAEAPSAVAVAEAPAAQPVAEAPAAEAPAAEPEAAPVQPQVPTEAAAEVVAEAQAVEAPPAEAAPLAAEPAPPAKPEIKPAGPQVVPKPARLKGPRVVRVEKPDVISRPVFRAPAAASTAAGATTAGRRGKAPAGVADEGEGKRTKRRSPRRRGGRSAASGEKIREWRDQDLAERSKRLAAAAGGTLRRHRASAARKLHEVASTLEGRKVELHEPITIKNLSAATGVKTSEIIRKLMQLGVMATINQVINAEQAEAAVVDHGMDLVIHEAKSAEQEMIEQFQTRQTGELSARAPVVTFLGHVDHGKTSLLDRIRNASVAAGEAGGITQHIGAHRYDLADKHVVFLDTPGHEAFTAMRARGANMTDVVVLVVAADDGVMPQTIEALNHAKAAQVPIVVALNKVDLPNANVQRVLGQLAEHGLNPQQWGGDVDVIETSAATGQGIDTLVETLSVMADILELKAEPDAPAGGYVIEAEISPQRGTVARLLVLNGTLKVGDILLAGMGHGRVRQMVGHLGRSVEQAGPSTPVEVSGLDEVPQAGDRFYVVDDLDRAKQVSQSRRQAIRRAALASTPAHTLEGLLSQIEAGAANELAIILKADVQGSVEALNGSIEKLATDEVRVKILHSAVGGITTGDVMLAEVSDAIIIGFNVVADPVARQLAESKGVDVRLYRVIYEVIDDLRTALEKGLAPEIRTETLGRAEIRQVFRVSRIGSVAGCMVTEGSVTRNASVRIIRDSVVIEDERSLESLRRFKDDVRDVRAGMECGLKVAGYNDIKEGDVLEFYQTVEVARTL